MLPPVSSVKSDGHRPSAGPAILPALLLAAGLFGCSSSSDGSGPGANEPPVVGFGVDSLLETEAAPSIRVPIVLDKTADVPIQLSIQLGGSASDGSGFAAADYEVVGGKTVTVPAGSLGLDLVLIPVNDDVLEVSETILLQLSSPSFGTLGDQSLAEIILLDGNGPGGGTSGPFGSSLMEVVNLVNLAGPRIFTAGESAGSAVSLSPAGVQVLGTAFAPDGKHMAYEGLVEGLSYRGIYILDEDGGTIVEASGAAIDGSGPIVWSPDGSTVAFGESFVGGLVGMAMVDSDGGNPVVVRPPGAVPADPSAEPYRWHPGSQRVAFLVREGQTGTERLVAVNRDGTEYVELSIGIAAGVDVDGTFQWSANGEWMAFTADNELYVVQSGGGGLQLVASDLGNVFPGSVPYVFQWSPTADQLAYVALDSRTGTTRLYVSAPGEGSVLLSADNSSTIRPLWSWSPDGTQVAFIAGYFGAEPELRVSDAEGITSVTVSGDHQALDLRWSPSGEHLAYRSQAGGASLLWSTRSDGTDRVPISKFDLPAEDVRDFASYSWSPNGERLGYVAGMAPEPLGLVLASDVPAGGDRIEHLGPLSGGDRILEHRWALDGERVYARVGVATPGQLLVGLWSIGVGDGVVVDTTSNAFGGDGTVGEFVLR